MKYSLYIVIMLFLSGCSHFYSTPCDMNVEHSFVVKLSEDRHVTIIPDVDKLGDIRRHWTKYTVSDFEKDVRRAVASANQNLSMSDVGGLAFRTLRVGPIGNGPGGPLHFRIADYAKLKTVDIKEKK
ncbi:MAG: hypothetical protein QGH15_21910 [Kiritimatiellia bacterium]|nr:hypothetical protein [Kiritimatiellia bacterium]